VRITVGIGQTPTTGHPGHHLWFGLDQVSRFLGSLVALGMLARHRLLSLLYGLLLSFVLGPLWANYNYNLGLLPPYLTFFSTWPGRQ